jgi:NitT/TauT family transport system substrate-binding protein
MDRSLMFDPGRRVFLRRTFSMGAASCIGLGCLPAAAELELETRKIRFVHSPALCLAPQYLAEELLRMDGITDVEYIPVGTRSAAVALADGRADISMWTVPGLIPYVDAGMPIVMLAGVHSGCYELFGNERVGAIRDLKGKTVAISDFGQGDHIMLSSILAYVGIKPQDVKWITSESTLRDAMVLFAEGKADSFFGFVPQPQELRAKKIGHVIVDTSQDRPWSQYFCCMVAANRNFAQRYPIATKRVLRAILIAADMCAAEPQRAARYLADKNYETRFGIGLEVLKSLSYTRWREANPEDTIRFHALRLHDVGMIKSTPQKLIAQGTDWRFLNELKKELKA